MVRWAEGLGDLRQGLGSTEFWAFLAHHEVRQRYRRSIIGPFWITITTGVMVVGVGILYGGLFGSDIRDYLPFLAVSLVLWNYMSQSIIDGCNMFIDSAGVLRQMKTARTTFFFKVLYRNFLIFLHNVVIIVLVFLFFGRMPSAAVLLFPLTFALFVVNIGWMALVAGILCTRYRDIGPIVASALQLLFFMTPVMWQPATLPNRLSFIALNPLYHLLEVVREPLLGAMPSLASVIATVGMAVVGWLAAIWLLARTRRRIVYWI